MAAQQLWHGALATQLSAATWSSVLRRVAVMCGFVGFGLASDNLATSAFAAFGALQLGLGEAALPLRRYTVMQLAQVVAVVGVGLVAAALSGTWWTVPFLTVVAFAQGATVSVGLTPRATGIGALAIGVIFAGVAGADPVSAATWLGIGASAQVAVSLLFWHRERTLAVRRALANALRGVAEIAQRRAVSGRTSNVASSQVDQARDLIRGSGVPESATAFAVADAIDRVRRTVVGWRVLRQPGLAERLEVAQALNRCVRHLDEAIVPPEVHASPATVEAWPVSGHLAADIAGLDAAITTLRDGGGESAPSPPDSRAVWSGWQGLKPGSPEFRNGIRMALGIAIAQALTLVLTLPHSYWIPLTVVFVVKPDWSFTVVRSSARVLGNLLAVILVPPALALTAGTEWGTVILVGLISGCAFRYFSGNYVPASFGVAGTILVLDQTLSPDAALYGWRIAFTLIGALVALVVSAAVPSWRGAHAAPSLNPLLEGLRGWTSELRQGLARPAAADLTQLRQAAEIERNNLIRLRPAVAATMLEPRPAADPRFLMIGIDAAERAHLSLLALTYQVRHLQEEQEVGFDVPSGVPPVAARPQDLAVLLEWRHLSQATSDLARAVEQSQRHGTRSAPGG